MEHLTMNRKEREQLIVFEKIKKEEITRSTAAIQLGITTRWVRKKYNRYLNDGAAGLVHKNRNKVSPKRWNSDAEALAMDLLREEWKGFGPTFTAEKLKSLKGISVSGETVRKRMIAHGLWGTKIQRIQHRKRRERKDMIGMFIQLDGSPHDWFEGRSPYCTLLVFIDDATSKILWLEFATTEAQFAVMEATKNYMLAHGRPQEFYVDRGSVFHVNNNNPEEDKKTQWENCMIDLSVAVSHARSPQAKGRVERANQTMQDRLVKEMRLAGIFSMDQANNFLRTSNFIEMHNQKFSVAPIQKGDAHRSLQGYDLNEIFCVKEERILTNDYTISFNKRLLQLTNQQRTIIRPKDRIIVKTYLDHSVALFIRQTKLDFVEIFSKPKKEKHVKIVKKIRLNKVHPNSRLWASGSFVRRVE